MAKTKVIAVRILAACAIGGFEFRPDDVVELPEDIAKAHAAAGECDPHPDAVSYCVKELKKSVSKLGVRAAAADETPAPLPAADDPPAGDPAALPLT